MKPDEIISIVEIEEEEETIDIEVSGNHLFYANDILTHNSSYGRETPDIGMESISDSIGIAYTADFMFSLYSNDELKASGTVLGIQMKNRWGSLDTYKRFQMGQDASKMKFFEMDSTNISKDVLTNDQNDSSKFSNVFNFD